jgi:hypothetical protein
MALNKSADVFEFLRKEGTPSQLPGSWARLSTDLFDLPDDHEKLLRGLEKRFALGDLLRSNVVQADADNGIALSEVLVSHNTFLCPLRKPRAKKPFDLLTGGGGTLLGQLPAIAVLDDAEIAARVDRAGGRLFLADSPPAILRSVGQPVAPAHDMAGLAGDRLAAFAAKMRIPIVGRPASDLAAARPKSARHRRQATSTGIPRSLILVNWRPSQLTAVDIPVMLEIRSHLLALAKKLEFPLDDFAIWKPSADQLARLEHALASNDPQQVREAALDRFEDACVMLDRWPLIESHEPSTLAETVSTMGAARDPFDQRAGVPDRPQLDQMLVQKVIAPLMQRADKTTNELDRNLIVTLVGLSQEYHLGAWRKDGSVALRDRVAAARQIQALTKDLRS